VIRIVVVALLAAAALAGGWALLAHQAPGEPSATISIAATLGGPADAGFARATGPRAFRFPEDHGPHPGYRTEWWYYTGNLRTAGGRHVGYQLTFFRHALTAGAPPRESAWAAREVWMAHFAVTDTAGGRFHPATRTTRGALDLAGARAAPFRVWVESWTAGAVAADALPMRLRADTAEAGIDLVLGAGKPVVLQGERGLSRKGPEDGNASYYYSLPRLPTRGTVRLGEARLEVEGLTWMDREWSTSALGDHVGWDWFALQLDDGRDLMVYRLRRADGSPAPYSAGSIVAADGTARALASGDVRLGVAGWWTSPRGGRYPAGWDLEVPSERLAVRVAPRLADQEHLEPVRYWEGAVRVEPADTTSPSGDGYAELVGYADRRDRQGR
jgi:predicted secreted hydrolase